LRKVKKRMSNTLSVKLAARKSGEASWYEGTVSIVGLKPTKLARRSDGSTQFPTKSAVSGAARNLAKSLGFEDVDLSDGSVAAPKVAKTVKSAAKKSAAKKSQTKSKQSVPPQTV